MTCLSSAEALAPAKFGIVMTGVFANKMSQVRFAEDDEVIETLIANGLVKRSACGLQFGALRRNDDAGDPTVGKEQFPRLREKRVTVMYRGLRAPGKMPRLSRPLTLALVTAIEGDRPPFAV